MRPRRVELELPETGVCGARPVQRATEETFCCGITAVVAEPAVRVARLRPQPRKPAATIRGPKACCPVPEKEAV